MKIQLSLTLLALCGGAQGFSSSSLKTQLTRPVIGGSANSKVVAYATVEKTEEVGEVLDDSSEPGASNLLGAAVPYSELTIGVLKETYKGENRVSQTPDSVRSLVKEGLTVVVEAGGKIRYCCYVMLILIK